MESLFRLRHYENLHIVFWLIKDTCWMLQLKWVGVAAMVPTVLLAVYLVIKTLRTVDVFINAAILFWILANSYWMMIEFFADDDHLKNLAGIPFFLGFVFVIIFYVKMIPKKGEGMQ